MSETTTWEPGYGFCAANRTEREALAKALELVRRRICAYSWGIERDERCDCKYGADVTNPPQGIGSEATGCPELREVIHRLLHRPESFTATEPTR
jgi:hypothetical protein